MIFTNIFIWNNTVLPDNSFDIIEMNANSYSWYSLSGITQYNQIILLIFTNTSLSGITQYCQIILLTSLWWILILIHDTRYNRSFNNFLFSLFLKRIFSHNPSFQVNYHIAYELFPTPSDFLDRNSSKK